jgi:uncharacterized membrane protein
MIPGIESRYVVPFAIFNFGWEWWQAFPVALAGNMFLVPLGLKFFKHEERFFRQFNWSKKAMDWLFSRIRKRTTKKVLRFKELALIFFVAVPLPFTGAGLGVVIAYLFNFKFYSSIIMILLGVIISTMITTISYLTGTYLI